MHNDPSDISREQYELIREESEDARRKTKQLIYTMYFVRYCMWKKVEYNVVCYLLIFQNGSCVITISKYGRQRMIKKMQKVFWNEF